MSDIDLLHLIDELHFQVNRLTIENGVLFQATFGTFKEILPPEHFAKVYNKYVSELESGFEGLLQNFHQVSDDSHFSIRKRIDIRTSLESMRHNVD
jgi:hypothetical protein